MTSKMEQKAIDELEDMSIIDEVSRWDVNRNMAVFATLSLRCDRCSVEHCAMVLTVFT